MGVIEVNADDWEKNVLKSETLVLVDFWHERCPWCIRLEPIFNEVAEEYGDRVKFVKINVLSSHENNHLALENGVMGTPTLIFYCEGRSVGTVVGFRTKEQLKELVEKALDNYKKCLNQSTKM